MNKWKILVPSTITIAAMPLISLAGCSAENKDAVWNLGEELVWSLDQPELTVEDRYDLTDKYFENINEHILAEDILFEVAPEYIQEAKDEGYIEAKVSVKVNDIDRQNRRLSFEYHFTWELDPADPEYYDGEKHVYFIFNKIPFNFMGTYDDGWTLQPSYISQEPDLHLGEWYFLDTSWYFDYFRVAGGYSEKGHVDGPWLRSGDTSLYWIAQKLASFRLKSTYFAKVPKW